MRVLVIGAGRVGAQVLRQLQLNPEITIITADARENPQALEQGVIEKVDIREPLTPMNLDYILGRTKPDLVLLTQAVEDLGLGNAPGIGLMADALWDELVSISNVPMIQVARSTSR